ncbi:hypothetical protein M409DRAFT_29096 [Zasmidium cellare ATCC 36951]|uniref:histidine kinase n=1 Tax=Zasmidium cellare ATCC 36951 TaxID=1080233 RepID=A0A6A6C0H9_ZASCE|nr:uncharacterized protein M409DRAFT_29096 [Zasmidium cellare ATCC 36951]KAF2160475.1 hypothetical protein M409DRAFT_29096 [Zasmidium cellare ATCC 36951]
MVSVTKSRSSSMRTFDWTRSTQTSDFQKRTKDVDWNQSPLGAIAEWPASLRQFVLLSTADPSPSAVVYGPLDNAAIVYNEAFAKLFGSKKTNLQGRPCRNELLDLCTEFDNVWERQVSNGCAEIVKNQRVRSDRLGFMEERLYTWKFVPIIGEDGQVAGSLVTVDEENKLPPRRERSKSAVREIGNAVRSAIDRTANQTAVNIRRLDEHFSGRTCNCEKLWQATQHMEYKEQRYEKFADQAPVGIVTLDKSYEVEWANKSFYDVMAQPPESKSLLSYIHPDDVAKVRSYFDLGCYETSFTFECRLKKWAPVMSPSSGDKAPDLSPSWILVSAYREAEFEQYTMAWIIDITSHKHAEEVLRKRMDEAIEEKLTKERFIDMTSHEVRNPLSAIVHCTDDIINDIRNNPSASADSVVEAAETIAYCTQHIRNIVGDVLTLSKLDSRLVEISPVPSRPGDVVQEALKIFHGELRAGAIELDFQRDDSLKELNTEWLLFDPNRMLQVLINLVTNAIKVVRGREKRKITVRVGANTTAPCGTSGGVQCVLPRQDPKPVEFGEAFNHEQAIYLVIQVEDTGPGLDSEEMECLFQRFTQANPKTESKYGGSGLGLFISRDLTELQGGRIGVASTPGEGSTFVFSVEARRTTAPKIPQRVPSLEIPTRLRGSSTVDSPVIAAPPLRPSLVPCQQVPRSADNRDQSAQKDASPKSAKRILVVEDNLINQKVLANQLRKRGYDVNVALHGGEALERLSMTPTTPEENPMEQAPFDCVLMDIEMPVMNGLDCVKKIREFELKCSMRALPVIAVTANARDEHGAAALAAGMQAITTKPYKIDDLVAQMDRVCLAAG